MKLAQLRKFGFDPPTAGSWKIINEFELVLLKYSEVSIHVFSNPDYISKELINSSYLEFYESGRLQFHRKRQIPEIFNKYKFNGIYQTHIGRGVDFELYTRATFANSIIPFYGFAHDLVSPEIKKALLTLLLTDIYFLAIQFTFPP